MIMGIVWLAVIGLFFAASWIAFFLFYPLPMSYTDIIKQPIQKLAIQRVAYLVLFVFCVVWGVVLSLAPGIVAYCLLIALAVGWAWLAVRNIYRVSIHKIRCLLNQLFIVLISVMYILL